MRFFVLLVVAISYSQSYGFMSARANAISRKAFQPVALSTYEDISLGAPFDRPSNGAYISAGGIKVDVEVDEVLDSTSAVSELVDMIDNYKGNLMLISYQSAFKTLFLSI
jgi:hypothetical protein